MLNKVMADPHHAHIGLVRPSSAPAGIGRQHFKPQPYNPDRRKMPLAGNWKRYGPGIPALVDWPLAPSSTPSPRKTPPADRVQATWNSSEAYLAELAASGRNDLSCPVSISASSTSKRGKMRSSTHSSTASVSKTSAQRPSSASTASRAASSHTARTRIRSIQNLDWCAVGESVMAGSRAGTVRFLGETQFATEPNPKLLARAQ